MDRYTFWPSQGSGADGRTLARFARSSSPRSAAVYIMEALKKAFVISFTPQCVELISISSLTKRSHAASLAQCPGFSSVLD